MTDRRRIGAAAKTVTLRCTAASRPTAARGRPLGGKLEIVFRPDPTIYDGRFANNGWLQELPKPITQADLGQRRADQPGDGAAPGPSN